MSQNTAPAVVMKLPQSFQFSQTVLLKNAASPSNGTNGTNGANGKNGTNGTNGVHSEDVSTLATVPLDVLVRFKGTFRGNGFNTIFRPNNTKKPTALKVQPTDGVKDNILQLNLTAETMVFSDTFGKKDGLVPNRGVFNQEDIALDGLPYTQSITDVTENIQGPQPVIHFETGLWMRVPGSEEPALKPSFARMASIPHGTTINAQCFEPAITKPGAPVIKKIGITPFPIGGGREIHFDSQDADNQRTHRLPENLSDPKFKDRITQEMITNPNVVLTQANKGKTFVDTTTFSISTEAVGTGLGGGTSNIGFLAGGKKVAGNANAAKVTADYWVSKVRTQLELQPWKPAHKDDFKKFTPAHDESAVGVPTFLAREEITEAKTVTVEYTQIQYSQTVILDFATLSWPHATVATLAPVDAELSESLVD
ncbi:uncharacterized protein CTRU02_204268 [Colletotrichum truncatum]|uniref:Uncharacterized protein n=1 Tax=Colletotrichum truncatum TaxID=5467 RepID=A0ACC3ZBW5_COLTU|nr:uncharacterized protein CTRU02_10120 [Colletotrichum truncatum]KAF6787825.1 hypothetical protein CTRU02_10120 [Colletotrichum truncatum]